MPAYQVNPSDSHDELCRRVTEDLTAQLDEHLQRRPPRPAPRGRKAGVHSGNHVHHVVAPHTTIFINTVYAPSGGPGSSSEASLRAVQQALHTVLERLPEAGLDRPHERAVRRQATEALRETEGIQPRRRRLRRLLHSLSTALVTGIASSGAHPLATELVTYLQQLPL